MTRPKTIIQWVSIISCCLVVVLLVLSRAPGSSLDFAAQRDVLLDAEQAWQRLSDLSLAHEYVPGVQRTELVTEATRGTGVSRRVFQSETEYLNETVISWREGRGFTLRLHDDDGTAPFPFAEALFHYELTPGPDGGAQVGTQLEVVMSGGLLGQWLGQSVFAGPLQSNVDAVIDSLQRYWQPSLTTSTAERG